MLRLFNKKKQELDPEEFLPFCTRCFGVGIVCVEGEEENSFCHMCGSQGACIPIKRKYIKDLSDRIYEDLHYRYQRGKEQGTDLQEGDTIKIGARLFKVKKVDRSVLNWEVHLHDGRIHDYTEIKEFTRKLNGQNNYNRP